MILEDIINIIDDGVDLDQYEGDLNEMVKDARRELSDLLEVIEGYKAERKKFSGSKHLKKRYPEYFIS